MNIQRLHELTEAWRDGILSMQDAAELNGMLRESEEARGMFRREAELHGLLHVAVTAAVIETAAEKFTPPASFSVPRRRAWLSWRPLTAAAAALVLALAATWIVSMPIRLVDNVTGNPGENSPAIHRWEHGPLAKPSPEGTKESFLPSLAGLCPVPSEYPAMNRWAIVTDALSTNRIGMDCKRGVSSCRGALRRFAGLPVGGCENGRGSR